MKNFKIKNCYLKNLTWLKVGGAAKLFKPESINELIEFKKHNDFFVLGAGSNIIAGEDIKKTILRLGRNFNYVRLEKDKVISGAATLDTTLAKFALDNNIKNFEFLSVIPGTIGGGLAMNAGAYGDDISKILDSAKVINEYGEVLTLSNEEIGFKYRGNNLPDGNIFIEATFNVEYGNSTEIKSKMNEMIKNKQASQPIQTKTCGSIFKNPPGKSAWQLIDQAGFRGFKIGKAEISSKHCNFLINNGCETSQELEELCNEVKTAVEKKFNIKLEYELIFI
jgi:UDP-N-acetylmuramate dehydrogenase